MCKYSAIEKNKIKKYKKKEKKKKRNREFDGRFDAIVLLELKKCIRLCIIARYMQMPKNICKWLRNMYTYDVKTKSAHFVR